VGEISIGRTRKRRESNNQERGKEGKEKEQRNEIKRLNDGGGKANIPNGRNQIGLKSKE
jgi:hypothetical protein